MKDNPSRETNSRANKYTMRGLSWQEVDRLVTNLVRLGCYPWQTVAPEYKILHRIGQILHILQTHGYWDRFMIGDRELRYTNDKYEILINLITGRSRAIKLK